MEVSDGPQAFAARRQSSENRDAERDPKHYLVEALALFDRLDEAPHRVASDILHKIGLEAAKRQRRHQRALGRL